MCCLKKKSFYWICITILIFYETLLIFNIILIGSRRIQPNGYIYITDNHTIHNVYVVFTISFAFLVMFVVTCITVMEDNDRYEIVVQRLVKLKKFLEAENNFLRNMG